MPSSAISPGPALPAATSPCRTRRPPTGRPMRSDDASREIGAVNTLWFEDGELCGMNTDVHGFLANLDEHAAGWGDDRGAARRSWRRRRVASRALRAEVAGLWRHPHRQPHDRAGRVACGPLWPGIFRPSAGSRRRAARRLLAGRQHHGPRHARTGVARYRPGPPCRSRACHRHRLCAARDAAV